MTSYERFLLYGVVAQVTYWLWEKESRGAVKILQSVLYVMLNVVSWVFFGLGIAESIVWLLERIW